MGRGPEARGNDGKLRTTTESQRKQRGKPEESSGNKRKQRAFKSLILKGVLRRMVFGPPPRAGREAPVSLLACRERRARDSSAIVDGRVVSGAAASSPPWWGRKDGAEDVAAPQGRLMKFHRHGRPQPSMTVHRDRIDSDICARRVGLSRRGVTPLPNLFENRTPSLRASLSDRAQSKATFRKLEYFLTSNAVTTTRT